MSLGDAPFWCISFSHQYKKKGFIIQFDFQNYNKFIINSFVLIKFPNGCLFTASQFHSLYVNSLDVSLEIRSFKKKNIGFPFPPQ